MLTPKQGVPRSILMRGNTPTQPSLPRNPPRSTGPQGTPGGQRAPRARNRSSVQSGDEIYLWVLIGLEIAFVGGMRKLFKRYHGG